jgi:hypothetical protein
MARKRSKAMARLRAAYRLSDVGDPYGRLMAWRFGLAERLHFDGPGCPSGWRYRPGAGQHGPDPDSWEYAELRASRASWAQLIRFGEALSRLETRIRAAGLDY